MSPRALVFSAQPAGASLAGRTLRSLATAGVTADQIGLLAGERFQSLLRAGQDLLLLRAGTWLARTPAFQFPPPSATGKGLCALGTIRAPSETEPETARAAAGWREYLAGNGGDFTRPAQPAPEAASVFLDGVACLRAAQQGITSLPELVEFARQELRLVHFPALDVHDDPGWRVLHVIPALHRGGAEQMTLDLLAELPALGVRSRLVTMGKSLRECFPSPPGMIELSPLGGVGARLAALVRIAGSFGADLFHTHLLPGDQLRRLAASGIPLMATVHNTQPGWPNGLAELRAQDAVLLAACAQAVEAELRQAAIPVPTRTVWNGIALGRFRLTGERLAARQRWRQSWGFGASDFVLLAVANPRPQKRLHLLPAILACLQRHLGGSRRARLVFCGEGLRGNPEAEQCVVAIHAEVARWNVEPHVRWTGSVGEVADVVAAADVLVSTSAHEGLSLAQLEALALGRPVVATDVGGCRELARDNSNVHLVPPQAPAEAFGQILAGLATTLPAEAKAPASVIEPAVAPLSTMANWSRERMAGRYRWLYGRVVAAARRQSRGSGLWLITNNFSTGGAQSSAQRLLLGLAQAGISVRAAVVEEEPDHPTPGRRALLQAGVPVLAVPPDALANPPAAVEKLLSAIDADPPQSVLFWNLRPACKILLADALLDIPVFDISPGEMFYASLEEYFARPRPGLPYRTARDYGARLAGVIVKYHAEAPRAAAALGAAVHVIPNGVPVAGEPAGQTAPADRLLAFGTAARINPQKRLEELLDAVHLAHPRLPPYTLRIAGGIERGCDQYAADLKARANGLPIEWLGEVSDLPAFHRNLDLFLMISEPAGCPNASLEAQAAGLPVIATDVGGAAEQMVEGRTGCLVPPRAPERLAEALVHLAAQPALRREMGAAARDWIRDRFALERMVSDYRRVCLAVPNGPRAVTGSA